MMQAGTALSPGFSDPTLDAQAVFRLVLDAMSHPGRIVELTGSMPKAPQPLDPATFALALTLLDFETPIWLDSMLAIPKVIDGLRFHCGCPIVDRPQRAAFALIGDSAGMPGLLDFALGTSEYPDRSTTLIVQTEGLANDHGVSLRGPGIKDLATLRAQGLPDDFERRWQTNRAGFPNGVDLILTYRQRLVCVPRTTDLEA